MSMWRAVETSLAIWALILCLILKVCSPAGAAEVPAAPVAVEVRLTHAEIEANLNLLNEAVKSIGLTQPLRLQDALMLLMKFQAALKADAEMRAKAAAAAPESAPAITGPYRGPFPKLADPPPALPQ